MIAELLSAGTIAFAALAVFALMVGVVRRHPSVGMGLIGLVLITVWDVPNPPPLITLSELSVYPADLITLLLLVVSILEASELQANLQGWLILWLFFGALIAVSLFRGIAAFGPGTAINETRPTLYFFFAMTWVFAVGTDRLKLSTAGLALGWALVLVASYHGLVFGVGNSASVLSGRLDLWRTGRILTAGQAAALLLCAGTVLLSPADSTRARRQFATVSFVAFLGIVGLAQHRSVWAAAAIGTVTVLLWTGQTQARKRALSSLVLGVWLILVGWLAGVLDNFGPSLVESASNLQTFAWRTSSWQSLISEAVARGPATVVLGEPFGAGYLRQVDTGKWTGEIGGSPHNGYVIVFLRLGLVGLITFGAMLIAALIKSRKTFPWCTFVIAAVATYSWAYPFDWYLAAWLGAAMAMSLGATRGRPNYLYARESGVTGPLERARHGVNNVKSASPSSRTVPVDLVLRQQLTRLLPQDLRSER